MTEVDPLVLWRLAAELSVEDAAILIAGGFPSDPGLVDYGAREAAFLGLRTAIKGGHLHAEICYRIEEGDVGNQLSRSKCWLVTRERLDDLLGSNGSDALPLPNHLGKVCIAVEPDWSATVVNVDNLRTWLRSRGHTTGFFFPADQPEPEDFMDPGHVHFAPELALAVSVWRALAAEQKFNRGTKAAIEAWIDSNPTAWKGEDGISAAAKDRVVTLVNWRRTGGAPTSNG